MRALLRCKTLAFLLAASSLLSACGGGGGGGGSGGGSTPAGNAPVNAAFSVNVDQTTLKFSAEQGAAIAPLTVSGSGTGTAPAAVYLSTGTIGAEIERVSTEVVGAQVKFMIYPKNNLAPASTAARCTCSPAPTWLAQVTFRALQPSFRTSLR
jgi:hypothetical protein